MHNTSSNVYLIFAVFFGISTIQVNAQIKEKALVVLAESKKQLSLFLEKIPAGSEAEFGFKNRVEFDIAIVQNPYNVVLPNADFYSDEFLDTSKTYIYHSNYWEVPISVDGKICCFLSGKFINENFRVISIGGKSIAVSINDLIYKSGIGMDTGYLLNLPELKKQYFISIGSKGYHRSYNGYEICDGHNAKYKNEIALNAILENEKKNLKKSISHEY